MKNRIRRVTACVLLSPTLAWAGSVQFSENFDDGTTGLVNGQLSRFSVVSGQGPDGSNALAVSSQGSPFEAFWGLGQPVGGPGNVVRISYDFRLGASPVAQQRLYLLGTYSDENKANYRSLVALHNRSIDASGTLVPSYQVRNQADGSVIANPLTATMNVDAWYSVDFYLNTDDVVPASAFRGFTRVLTADGSTSLGVSSTLAPNGPDGVNYTQWQIRALQFFNSPNATFAGFGNTMYFDNVRLEYVNTEDLTRVTRDAFAGTGGARSTFNNDGTINAGDATVFIEQVMATRRGDANFDRQVGFADLLALAQNYNSAGTWSGGDFDGDGLVGFPDLLVLAQNYGFGTAGVSLADDLHDAGLSWASALLVPEPSVALAGGGLTLAGLMRRRRLL